MFIPQRKSFTGISLSYLGNMVYSGFTPSKKLATNFNIGWGTMKESFQKLPLNLEVPAYFSYSL